MTSQWETGSAPPWSVLSRTLGTRAGTSHNIHAEYLAEKEGRVGVGEKLGGRGEGRLGGMARWGVNTEKQGEKGERKTKEEGKQRGKENKGGRKTKGEKERKGVTKREGREEEW